MAASKNFLIEKGATFSRVLTWKDSSDTPVNLTGYTARMKIKESYDSTDALLSLTTSNGMIVLGGSAGTINITISSTDTATLAATQRLDASLGDPYVYDLELESSGVVTRLIQGNIHVSDEVTT